MGHAEQCRSGDDTPVNGSVVDEDELGFGDGGGTLTGGWEVQPMDQSLGGEPFPLVGRAWESCDHGGGRGHVRVG